MSLLFKVFTSHAKMTLLFKVFCTPFVLLSVLTIQGIPHCVEGARLTERLYYSRYMLTWCPPPLPSSPSLPSPHQAHRVSLADVVWLEVVAAVLVDGHLAGIAAVALPPQPPDAVLTLLTVGHLEPLGHKRMAVDPAHFLPPPSSSPVVDPHWRGGREGGREGGKEEGGRGGRREGGREGGREHSITQTGSCVPLAAGFHGTALRWNGNSLPLTVLSFAELARSRRHALEHWGERNNSSHHSRL